MLDQLALSPTEQDYHIEFLDGRRLSHQWTITLGLDRLPLLAFDSTNRSYLCTPRGSSAMDSRPSRPSYPLLAIAILGQNQPYILFLIHFHEQVLLDHNPVLAQY